MIFTKNKERVPAIRAAKYQKKYVAGNVLAYAHFWRESTEIEYNAFLTTLGVNKTPYLGSDVMALYLQLVLRNWVVSVQLFVVCSRGRNR